MVSVKRYYPTRDQPKLSPDTKTVVHLFFFFLPLENNKVSSGGREEARSDFHLQKSPVSSAFYKPTPSSRGKGVRGKSEILEGNKKKKSKSRGPLCYGDELLRHKTSFDEKRES